MKYTQDKVREIVTNIVVEQLGVNPEQVVPTANFFEDLGCDSLDIVELVVAFEEEFGIEIADEDAEKVTTVEQAIDAIFELVKTF